MIWAKEETLPREELERDPAPGSCNRQFPTSMRGWLPSGKMDKAGVAPEDIRSLDDLRRLRSKLCFR